MSALAPMTELEAVNLMLADLGERPVNTLTGSQRLDVQRAILTLASYTRQINSMGWWFNEEEVEVAVNGAGQYIIPDDFVKVDYRSGGPGSGSRGLPNFVVRERKLYDTVNATDTFSPTDPSIRLRITRLIPFEDLPASAREYVYAASSIAMQSRTLGSASVDADLRGRAVSAIALLKQEEVENVAEDTTYSPRFFDLMHRR